MSFTCQNLIFWEKKFLEQALWPIIFTELQPMRCIFCCSQYCIVLLFMSCALESQEFINYLVSFLSIDCWYSDGLQSPRHQAFFMLIAHCLFLKLFFSFSFINFQLWLRVIGHKLDTVLVLVKHPWASCWLAVQVIQLDDPFLVQPKQECTESRPDKF